MRIAHDCRALLPALALGWTCVGQAAGGLQATPAEAWPAWQTRVSLLPAGPLSGAGFTSLPRRALFGDDYPIRQGWVVGARWRSGFRVAGGLVLDGLRSTAPVVTAPWFAGTAARGPGGVALDQDVWPYAGLGYSGLMSRSGWGFTADLGVMWRFPEPADDAGRYRVDDRGWEGALRQLDALPMVQFGVYHRF